MIRPFAISGLTLFFVMLALAFVPGVRTVMAAGAVCFLLFLGSLLFQKTRKTARLPLCFFSALTGCLLMVLFCSFQQQPALSLAGTRAVLHCSVCGDPYTDYKQRSIYTVKATLDDGTKVPGYVRVSVPKGMLEGAAEPGDTLHFTGRLYALGGDNRDSVRSYHGRMLFLGATPILNLTVEKARVPSPYMRILRLRQSMMASLRRAFDERQASFLIAVLFGEKSGMSEALYTSFRRAGAAHIMAVSGLHLTTWVFFLLALWRKRTQNLRLAGGVLSVVVVMLMAFAGFSGSVLRAGLMVLVYLLGFILRRDADALNSLGFAVTVLLVARPAFCMHVGFLLSVLSTLAILVLAMPLATRLEAAVKKRELSASLSSVLIGAGTSVLMNLSVSLMTLPVQIYAFGTVPTAGVLTNLLLLPFLLPLLVLAGLFLALHGVPVLGSVLRFFADAVATYCIKVAGWVSKLPFAELTVPKQAAVWSLAVLLLAALAVGVLLYHRRRLDLWRRSVL